MIIFTVMEFSWCNPMYQVVTGVFFAAAFMSLKIVTVRGPAPFLYLTKMATWRNNVWILYRQCLLLIIFRAGHQFLLIITRLKRRDMKLPPIAELASCSLFTLLTRKRIGGSLWPFSAERQATVAYITGKIGRLYPLKVSIESKPRLYDVMVRLKSAYKHIRGMEKWQNCLLNFAVGLWWMVVC